MDLDERPEIAPTEKVPSLWACVKRSSTQQKDEVFKKVGLIKITFFFTHKKGWVLHGYGPLDVLYVIDGRYMDISDK